MENYSYITLLTNDSYVYGVALLVESMERVGTKYPLHVLITDTVSAASIEILNQLGVTYELLDKIETPEDIMAHNVKYNAAVAGTWRYCWTKFKIFDQTQFDKIIFLDADIMILKNIDHLFEKPHMTAALDGEYFGLWPNWPHFNSGCVVIEPSHQLFLDILDFANNLDPNNLPDYIVADQEVLNLYFKDWPEQKELHLNKYYNIFAPYVLPNYLEDTKVNTYFIHYVGRKPWTFWLRTENDVYDEYYYALGKEMVETKIRTLDWDTIRSKIVLTVYAICKNEKANVKKWLDSFGEADYVCVLDTGSDDGTWELLQKEKKKRRNLIIDQKVISPWRFDTARNESMKLIPQETTMYFMADLDEVIKEKGWSSNVKRAWDPLFDRGTYTYNRDVDKTTDTVVRAIPEYRIHSKEWNKWVNIVHEALINVKGQKQFYIETCTHIDITVWHYPKENKSTEYMELCEADLKEYPDDWVMHLQLAIEYEIRNLNEKALEHFLYIINNPNTLQAFEQARCYFGIGRILKDTQKQKALDYFREGRLIDPTFVDNYLIAAELYYNDKKYSNSIELCLGGLKNCTNAVWCSVYDAQSFYPYQLLGLSYYFMGQKVPALAYMAIAQVKNPDNSIKQITNEIAMEIAGEWRK